MIDSPTFEFKLMTRTRILVDCRATMLIVPAFDGQLGLMKDHSPIVTSLGLGILHAKGLMTHDYKDMADKFFLIDDGVVRMSNNHTTVLAYDITGMDGIAMDRVDDMIEEADKLLAGDAFTVQTRQHLVKKAALIKYLVELAAIPKKS